MRINLIEKFLKLHLLYAFFLFYHIADKILNLSLHLFYFPHQAVKLCNVRLFMYCLKSAIPNLHHLSAELTQWSADHTIKIEDRHGKDQKRYNYDECHHHSPLVNLLLIYIVRQCHCINVSHLTPVCHDLIALSRLDFILPL